jgi:ketosteroid isomerase-like protein
LNPPSNTYQFREVPMKYGQSIPALALVLAVAACQPASETPPMSEAERTFTAEDEAAIRDMLDKFVVDAEAADWASILSYYVEDAVRMPPNESMVEGHAAIAAWLDVFPPITDMSLTPQVVDGDGELAYVRYVFTIDLAPPDAEPVHMVGKGQTILERQADGSWLIVSDIWNADTPMGM